MTACAKQKSEIGHQAGPLNFESNKHVPDIKKTKPQIHEFKVLQNEKARPKMFFKVMKK